MTKNVTLVIKANQEFIRHDDTEIHANAPLLNSFYESISTVYIPLLRMVEKLESENIPCRFGLVMPPVLCNMLNDEVLQEGYIKYLDKRAKLGKNELKRNEKENAHAICELVTKELVEIESLKTDFTTKYNKTLIPFFADFMQKGYIELLGTCGTDIFMPHYADLKEVLSAQIECGLHAFRQFFNLVPEGFWLPDFGYFPGVEKLIRSYGYTYTILDTRSVLFAENIPTSGIFYPSRTDNSLVIFAPDKQIDDELFGEDGFIRNVAYKNQNRDIGFELTEKQLSVFKEDGSVRYSTGFKYWNRCFEDSVNCIYNEEQALEQVKAHAKIFIQKRTEILTKAADLLSDKPFVTTLFTLDAKKTFGKWHETISWLEMIFRYAKEFDINFTTLDKQCEEQYNLEKFVPYYASYGGAGYGENLLSSKNCWMMRYLRKASERMVDLAERFSNDTGLKTRLLNLGAKELMIAQSSNLQKMINHSEFPEYAEKRFKQSINAFTSVFDSLGSNTVSTEWLTTLEAKDSIFPWMNYRIYSKKR